jgi:chloride channel protein, CIC family
MPLEVGEIGARVRITVTRFLSRFGMREDSFLLLLAAVIGVVTGAAAVGFHESIDVIRDLLYTRVSPEFLYGSGMWLLIVIPAVGGLAVGVVSVYVFRTREGHGIVDVVESVVRTSGFQKPLTAVEKIVTSAFTIGSGGSAGSEGPIVQIGAAIASAVSLLFRVSRTHMPVLIGCGSAAGISAIFNAPFGGVLFTLEVIMQDFSIRTFTPIVVASVIAQVTTQGIMNEVAQFHRHHGVMTHQVYQAIFAMPAVEIGSHTMLNWSQVGNFIVLGAICGLLGLALTRAMYYSETVFHHMPIPKVLRPAMGGALVGVLGVVYLLLFGGLLLHAVHDKPFDFSTYPMPAFFGDGYGVIQKLLTPAFFATITGRTILLLIFLCGIKIVATCLTLSSGGSGGVIAPSLFIGATAGAVIGTMFRAIGSHFGIFQDVQPELYALVGMGAVLAACIHAPLASILICFELTQDYKVMLPAMLACVLAVGVARLFYQDSIYTLSLRLRGVRVGRADLTLLHRLIVEQVPLEPASILKPIDPLSRLIELTETNATTDFVVVDDKGKYLGMVVANDIRTALMNPDAIPLLLCEEIMRTDLPVVKNSDDFSKVLDLFAHYDVAHFAVELSAAPGRVIGLVSRAGLMSRYQKELESPA